ncbi:MAG: hypothetical protein JXM71_05365 [Spirochaetales bacterium]|nr:hypothetical protein [Spirochaetales bacterium]
MNENVGDAAVSLSRACGEAIAAYRDSGKTVQSPAIRKVLDSILRQKSEHLHELGALEAWYSGTPPRVALKAAADPEAILRAIQEHETAFAAALEQYSASIPDEDPRQRVHAMADGCRKFASWATDHLDLLALF